MVTQRDIATRAGVSVSVVSAVVNDTGHTRMSDETRRRVEHAIDDLGYSPHHSARALRRRRSGIIAVVLYKLDNPVFAPLIRGIHDEANERDLEVLLSDAALVRAGGHSLTRVLSAGTVDGVLLRGGSTLDEEALAALALRSAPLLMVESCQDHQYPWVGVDEHGAAQLATRFLLNLGHRDIMFAGGDAWHTSRLRYEGYADTMRRAGASPAEQLATGYGESAGRDAVRRALESARPPTALIVNNAMSAVGSLAAAHDLGLRIPDELSIVALHDIPLADHIRPALTTVRLPMYELGRHAVAALCDLLAGEPPALGTLYVPEPELIVRASVTRPPSP